MPCIHFHCSKISAFYCVGWNQNTILCTWRVLESTPAPKLKQNDLILFCQRQWFVESLYVINSELVSTPITNVQTSLTWDQTWWFGSKFWLSLNLLPLTNSLWQFLNMMTWRVLHCGISLCLVRVMNGWLKKISNANGNITAKWAHKWLWILAIYCTPG